MTRLEPFNTWIRRPGHGRCQSCGFHIATQGHGQDCRQEEAVTATLPDTTGMDAIELTCDQCEKVAPAWVATGCDCGPHLQRGYKAAQRYYDGEPRSALAAIRRDAASVREQFGHRMPPPMAAFLDRIDERTTGL